jgi:polysaccharide pyruvyl transferase CsaB
MAQIRAVLCGYYGMGNGGDEALLASALQMLPESVHPVVLSGNLDATRDRYRVETCNRKAAFSLMKVLRESDWFVWGGGSLIQDATSALSPLYYAGLMGLAQRMGLKTIAWAQGIGPLERNFTLGIAQQAFAGCNAVSVRDRASAALLSQWNIPFVLAPDPVWALESQHVPGLWELSAPRVAVTLRSHPKLTQSRLDTLTRALIDFQKATQTCILFIPFQSNRDLAISEQIQPQLPGESRVLVLEDPRQLKGVFRGVEMAIGMRYHSLVMAASQECRCFAISYDPKIAQLQQDLDIPGWELDELPEDANAISRAWLQHYADGDALSSDRIQSLSDRALMHRDIFAQMMDN